MAVRVVGADGPTHPPPTGVDVLGARLAGLREQIAHAADGRRITIVAVTKGHGADAVAAARAAGLDDLGESYARELVAKAGMEASAGPPTVPGATGVPGLGRTAARWHFLGAVQRRKVRALAPLVHLWQSVDREAAGREIARHAAGAAVLVQVNVTGAPGRGGCSWEEAPGLVATLQELALDVRGLMAVAGRHEPRPQFRRLATLARDLGLPELSMGMSGDLEVAIQEGATMVRVGSALFGPRPVPDPDRRRR